MQLMSPTFMKEANAVLEETTQLFPECAEAWSLYGQVCIELFLPLLFENLKNIVWVAKENTVEPQLSKLSRDRANELE